MKRYQSWIISFSVWFIWSYFDMRYQLWGMSGIWYGLMMILLLAGFSIAGNEGLRYLIQKLNSKPQETVRIELDEPLKEGEMLHYARGRSRHD
jgi:hypothetical protein